MKKPDDYDETPAKVRAELEAMTKIVDALAPLSPRMRAATLRYAEAYLDEKRERAEPAACPREHECNYTCDTSGCEDLCERDLRHTGNCHCMAHRGA